MHSVGHWVWNGIAAHGGLETAFARHVFPMNGAAMMAALDGEASRLRQRGCDSSVIVAYLTMMPLLWERRAIARYVGEHPELAGALPNVESVDEAVAIASLDHPLDESAQWRLAALLSEPPHAPSSTMRPARNPLEALARANERLAETEPNPELAAARRALVARLRESASTEPPPSGSIIYRVGERVRIKAGPHPWSGETGAVTQHDGYAVDVMLDNDDEITLDQSWVERILTS